MPIQTLTALSDGPNTGWTYAGSTDIAVVMGTESTSDETDRINAVSGFGNAPRHDWYLEALSQAVYVTNVDTRFNVRSSGSETIGASLWDGATEENIRNADPGGSVGNYTVWTDTNVNHPTNGAGGWAPTDFPGGGAGILQGVYSSSNLSGSVFCTYSHVNVTYTPPTGGFMYLVGCWAGALAPIAGAIQDVRELIPFFAKKKIRPSNLSEMRAVVEALQVRRAYSV